MGKKLDSVKNKGKEGGESYKKSAEQGKKAVTDVKKMKSIIEQIPADVDDEIVAAQKSVEQATKSDAEGYMKSEVSSELESGKKAMDAANKAASDQIQNNEKVKSVFSKMDSVGAFGKNARAEGTGNVERSTSEFNKEINANTEHTRDAEQDFKKNLGDISSTF